MSDAALRVPVPSSLSGTDVQALDDRRLCDLVRAGADTASGRAAFGELYERHRGPALAQALLITRDRGKAEDLVSETFTRVLRALANGKGPTESVLGYLLISLRSEATRTFQIDAGTVTIAPDVLTELFDEAAEPVVASFGERDQIGRAFATLSEDARRVLWLLDVEGITAEAASEYLGMQAGAVRVVAHRARKKLAAAYLQQYVESPEPGCVDTARLLGEHVRGELGMRDTARVEQHLPECSECKAQVSRLRDLGQQLRACAGPIIAGSGIAGTAAIAGGDASAASATSPAKSSADAAQSVGASSGSRVVGWLGLAAGVALVVAGAFSLFPKDAIGTPAAPTVGTEPTSSHTLKAETDLTEDIDPETRPNLIKDVPDPKASRLPKVDPTISPDDTTPNWKLRD